MLARALWSGLMLVLASHVSACEMCAVYNADAAENAAGQGFSFAVSEQYVPCDTVQLDGRELPSSILDQTFLHDSTTHLVPTWNFTEAFSLGLSFPIIHKEFKRFQLTGTGILTEAGDETGLGDIALIGRWRVVRVVQGQKALTVNLLGGVKFPTGEAGRLQEEVDSTRELDAIYGVGHQHSVSGVHLSDLALGSGSYDGLMGATANARWQRFFCNIQFQYYLRTTGESGYRYGDEWMISGGPGFFLILRDTSTLSLQLLATYDTSEPDTVLGRENPDTGMSAIYLGPQLQFTLGDRFSVNAGVDIPINIENQGFQNVPDYRFHAGLSFRF